MTCVAWGVWGGWRPDPNRRRSVTRAKKRRRRRRPRCAAAVGLCARPSGGRCSVLGPAPLRRYKCSRETVTPGATTITGPLPVTARFAVTFRSAIVGKLREGGANYQRLRPPCNCGLVGPPLRAENGGVSADPFTPPFTPPRGRPRRRRARAPHLPLSDCQHGQYDQILVEIELKWTDVVLGAVRHVLSWRRSQFIERVRVQVGQRHSN